MQKNFRTGVSEKCSIRSRLIGNILKSSSSQHNHKFFPSEVRWDGAKSGPQLVGFRHDYEFSRSATQLKISCMRGCGSRFFKPSPAAGRRPNCGSRNAISSYRSRKHGPLARPDDASLAEGGGAQAGTIGCRSGQKYYCGCGKRGHFSNPMGAA